MRILPPTILCLAVLLSPAAAQSPTGKRPLRHTDYDGWRSLQGTQLSRDGKFLAYTLVPQDGDGELVARNLTTGTDWRHGIGSRGSPAEPAAAAGTPAPALPAVPSGGRLVFTPDSRFLVFTIAPSRAETEKARKEKKKPEELPRTGLGILDLGSGHLARVERVKSFQVPEDAGSFVAYLLEGKPEASKPASTPTPPATSEARTRRKTYGSDLVVRNLSGPGERTIPDVLEFYLTKDGKHLVYVVSSRSEESNGVYLLAPGTPAPPVPLLTGRGRYTRLTWDEKQTQLAFLSDRDDAAAAQPKVKLYHWERKESQVAAVSLKVQVAGAAAFVGARPLVFAVAALQAAPAPRTVELVGPVPPGMKPGLALSDRGGLYFSEDGGRLFFGVAPPPPEPPKEDKDAPAEEKVVVDLWHWKDDFIQPMQKARAGLEQNRTFRAVYHIKERKCVQLADTDLPDVTPSRDGRWALADDDRPYRMLVGHDTAYRDHYLVNTLDGSRKLLLKKQQWGLGWSPGGSYGLFYDGKDWNSLRVADGKVTNLTGKLGVCFWNETYDMPGTPFAYGSAGWAEGDQHVLLYDRYDIWQVAADGSGAVNLTQGLGRKQQTQFRLVNLDPRSRAVNLKQPLLLRAENEHTRDTGFCRLRPGSAPETLIMAARYFSPPTKAKDADVLVLTASTFNEYPDLLVTDGEFKSLKKVSNANPQKAQLLWGTAELIHFKNADGVPLSGVLIKPENFDAAKKYPLLVYIYERLSQSLHRFVDPRPGTSVNLAYYVSNGYLVFLPDIAYTVGYPGQSALKCVLPGIQAVVDRGGVDEKAIGIQGHSWGGYQIAYMITQTGRFRAASAGAPVANMTSAYDGIRWGTGLPRQFQYERTQSRIGGSLWQYPMRYVENSPVFQADRVQTPLLMLHNDQDDAVPWYQGIEYFLALRRLGKEVYMFNYVGEFHGLRKRVNQKDYTVRMQEFFDHYLKGAAKPEWMAKGIPYKPRERTPAVSPPPAPLTAGEEPDR